MKMEKNILIAFFLNLGFAIFEFAGGIFTDERITSNEQLLDILRSGKFEMLKDNDKPQ